MQCSLNHIISQNGDEEDQSLAPRFLKTALGQLEVTEGDSARINCRVSGRPPPDIQWYLNGQRLIQDDRHKIIVNESGCHALLLTKTVLNDSGTIACVIEFVIAFVIASVIAFLIAIVIAFVIQTLDQIDLR